MQEGTRTDTEETLARRSTVSVPGHVSADGIYKWKCPTAENLMPPLQTRVPSRRSCNTTIYGRLIVILQDNFVLGWLSAFFFKHKSHQQLHNDALHSTQYEELSSWGSVSDTEISLLGSLQPENVVEEFLFYRLWKLLLSLAWLSDLACWGWPLLNKAL